MTRNWWCSRKAIEESGVAISHYFTEKESSFIALWKDMGTALSQDVIHIRIDSVRSNVKTQEPARSLFVLVESNHGPEVQ
ncbi:hypothetical protein EUGRSUZ_H05082 [Eucalyptus grandis]|uniref:Uncharacterized protein n=2 Tax=Eucalyptus grandis TaxID=71139 RepID=A0ACC3JZH0_EUCGR|nr:hypothetical protein EUGRSUZ_H05082 [Eucalyptus grandis]